VPGYDRTVPRGHFVIPVPKGQESLAQALPGIDGIHPDFARTEFPRPDTADSVHGSLGTGVNGDASGSAVAKDTALSDQILEAGIEAAKKLISPVSSADQKRVLQAKPLG
jgi:hypothetical protein